MIIISGERASGKTSLIVRGIDFSKLTIIVYDEPTNYREIMVAFKENKIYPDNVYFLKIKDFMRSLLHEEKINSQVIFWDISQASMRPIYQNIKEKVRWSYWVVGV